MRRAALIGLLLLVGCSGKRHAPPFGRGVQLIYALPESIPTDQRDAALEAAVDVIRRRIDALKLDPTVYPRGGRIYIEIPNPPPGTAQTIRAVMRRTGRLEFRAVVPNLPAMQRLYDRARNDAAASAAGIRAMTDSWSHTTRGNTTDVYLSAPTAQAIDTWYQKVARDDGAALPDGYQLVYEAVDATTKEPAHTRSYVVRTKPDLVGHIDDAQVDHDPTTNQPIIMVTFDKEGGHFFAELTREQTGNKLAILLDGHVQSAPVVQEAIGGGRIQINLGAGDPITLARQADEMAAALRAGSLDTPLDLMSVNEIGPAR